MKKYSLIIVSLMALWGQLVVGAPGPIDVSASFLIKRLNKSIHYPLDIYRSPNAVGVDHDDKIFTTRVISRLEHDGLPSYDQTAIRNEICASQKIQTANMADTFAMTPGAFGFYKDKESIVAVYDDGLAGEPLDSVLRKLRYNDDASKIAIAASYALEMVRLLNAIHAADITWNNLSLSNFYVRLDGSLTAIDFTMAKNSPGGLDTQDKKNERLDFLAQVVRTMYEIIFPVKGNTGAEVAYNAFTTLANVTANWQTIDWTNAAFNNVATGAATPPTYIPGIDGALQGDIGIAGGVLRANHDASGLAPNHGINGFVAHPDVVNLLRAAPGAPAWADLVTACTNW